jgi:hypothetical protein
MAGGAIGRDTQRVLADLLGMSREEILRLSDEGVIYQQQLSDAHNAQHRQTRSATASHSH